MTSRRPVRHLEDMDDGTHRVPLTRGKHALIDSADAAFVGQWNWCAYRCPKGSWYAVRTDHGGATQKTVRLHRALLDAPDEMDVDHRNGDTLDNRQSNIRLATVTQNAQNVRRNKANSSGFKGVHWAKSHGKWVARIKVAGRRVFLGLFDDPAEAHRAYREAGVRFHGEFANAG